MELLIWCTMSSVGYARGKIDRYLVRCNVFVLDVVTSSRECLYLFLSNFIELVYAIKMGL